MGLEFYFLEVPFSVIRYRSYCGCQKFERNFLCWAMRNAPLSTRCVSPPSATMCTSSQGLLKQNLRKLGRALIFLLLQVAFGIKCPIPSILPLQP
jgi:hypothetical protein